MENKEMIRVTAEELPFVNHCTDVQAELSAKGYTITVKFSRDLRKGAIPCAEFRWEGRPLAVVKFRQRTEWPECSEIHFPRGYQQTVPYFKQWMDLGFMSALMDAIDPELGRLIHLRCGTGAPNSDILRTIFRDIRPDVMHVY